VVDINWVGDVHKLFIIIFAIEFYNGTSSGIDWHYKCRHIIATLHPDVTIYNLGYICTRAGIPRFRAYGAVMIVVAAYCWGQEAQNNIHSAGSKIEQERIAVCDGYQTSNITVSDSETRKDLVHSGL